MFNIFPDAFHQSSELHTRAGKILNSISKKYLLLNDVDPLQFNKTAQGWCVAFTFSAGNPIRLGLGADRLGLLKRIPLLQDPTTIDQIYRASCAFHPNIDLQHKEAGYGNYSGTLSIIATSIVTYQDFLEELITNHSEILQDWEFYLNESLQRTYIAKPQIFQVIDEMLIYENRRKRK